MIKTGFNEAIQYGTTGNEILVFYIRRADGKDHPTIQIRCSSRKQLAKILIDFRKARRAVKSSADLFGGSFQIGSLRWLASYSGFIRDFTCKTGRIKKINFKNRYLRAILKSVE